MTPERSILPRGALPYVLPFALFSVFLAAEGAFPDSHYLVYPFKTLAVAAVIAWFWKELPGLRPSAPLASVALGVIAIALWIGLDPWLVHYAPPLLGRNPFVLYPAGWAWFLFAWRLLGIAFVVPVMEELFWRGFLMRWLIEDDFTRVPFGTYRPVSFLVTTAFFALVHGAEWPLALIVGVLYGLWFLRTKTLGDIMLAHGVTNLLLALYCLVTGDWHFLSIIAPPGK
jgi:CAAX prenyl protease-like protein